MGVEKKEIEEGLAILSQLIDEPEPRMFIAALRYYSSILASELSFVEVFKKLKVYLPDDQDCWRECLRVKRGIEDTSEPKGMYKDQLYFLGAYELLKKRKSINF
jgi:hypothetical protein